MALRTRDLDLLDVGVLALPAGQHAIGVVRLDPALEEARRHRQMRRVDLDPLQVHAGKPALENVLADFGAKLLLHSQPALLIRARHFFLWCRMVFLGTRWKRTAVIPPEPLRAVHHSKRTLMVVGEGVDCGRRAASRGEAGRL